MSPDDPTAGDTPPNDAAPAVDKRDKRIRQTLAKYRAAPAPGALRAALAAGLDADALASPEGLARVQAELKALKFERRALRRLEALLLGHVAGAQAAPDDETDD